MRWLLTWNDPSAKLRLVEVQQGFQVDFQAALRSRVLGGHRERLVDAHTGQLGEPAGPVTEGP